MADHSLFEKIDAGVRDAANLVVKGVTLGYYSADDLAGHLDAKIGSVDPATRGNDVSTLQAAEKAKTQKLDSEISIGDRAMGAAVGVGAMGAVVATGGLVAGVGPVSTAAGVATTAAISGTVAGVAVATLSPGGLLGSDVKPQVHRNPYRKAMSTADLNGASLDGALQTREVASNGKLKNTSNGELNKLEGQGLKGKEEAATIKNFYHLDNSATASTNGRSASQQKTASKTQQAHLPSIAP